uniref:Uncharacterized protein n=1 Tax=Physcomitrium patens TaxID=3218 RepID=A0A2K1KKU7_PHYPA|nr:hypothetical protein PHYPA_008079 [Physcomitrium patens]
MLSAITVSFKVEHKTSACFQCGCVVAPLSQRPSECVGTLLFLRSLRCGRP